MSSRFTEAELEKQLGGRAVSFLILGFKTIQELKEKLLSSKEEKKEDYALCDAVFQQVTLKLMHKK